jgi:hypothetical protein
MASGFTVKITDPATHRVVPEDGSDRGINVPYLASDAKLRPGMRLELPGGGWAQYDELGMLARVHVPEGWRLEQWKDVLESKRLTFDDVLARIGLRRTKG